MSPEPDDPSDDFEVDFERVRKVSGAIELSGIRLRFCETESNAGPEEFADDWAARAFIGFRSVCEGWSVEDKSFSAQLDFLALHTKDHDVRVDEGMPEFDEGSPPRFFLEAGFVVDYSLLKQVEIDEEDLNHFVAANSTFHAWPYWRELVQSMTSRMGLAPLVVGPFRLTRP